MQKSSVAARNWPRGCSALGAVLAVRQLGLLPPLLLLLLMMIMMLPHHLMALPMSNTYHRACHATASQHFRVWAAAGDSTRPEISRSPRIPRSDAQPAYFNTTFGTRLIATRRLDAKEGILHFEYFHARWPLRWIMFQQRVLPKFLRPVKPMAKAGIRTYSVKVPENSSSYSPSTDSMRAALNLLGNNSSKETEWSIGLLVFMWVYPRLRGLGLGDVLLQQCMNECRLRGDSHLLLVHDDQGSSKLIRFYSNRGFQDISKVVHKGMIRAI